MGFPGRTMAKAPMKATWHDGDRAHTDSRRESRNPAAQRTYMPVANDLHGRTYRQPSNATLGSFNTISSGNSNQPATPPFEAEPATIILEGSLEYPQNQWTGSPVEDYQSTEPRDSQWTDSGSNQFAPQGQAPSPYFSPYYTPGEHNGRSPYSGKEIPPSVLRGSESEGGRQLGDSRNHHYVYTAQTPLYVENLNATSSHSRAPLSPYDDDQNGSTVQPSAISRRNTSECIETRMSDPEPSYTVPTNPLPRRHTEVQQETSRASGEHRQYQYKDEVDVWQDGLKDPDSGKTAILNFVILQTDTACQRSNWVSKQIIERLRARTQPMPSTPEFFSFNGTEIIPTHSVRLSFRSTEEGPGPAHTAMFYVAAGQVPFEMLLGQDYVFEHGILPKANLRGVWVLTSNAPNKDAKKQQAVRDTEHQDRVAKHERNRKQKQKEKEALSSRQNSSNTGSTGGSGRLIGWLSK